MNVIDGVAAEIGDLGKPYDDVFSFVGGPGEKASKSIQKAYKSTDKFLEGL